VLQAKLDLPTQIESDPLAHDPLADRTCRANMASGWPGFPALCPQMDTFYPLALAEPSEFGFTQPSPARQC